MCAKHLPLVLLAGLLLVAGCQPGAPVAAAPSAVPLVLQVEHTPALRELAPLMSDCARQVGSLGIVVNELPTIVLDENSGAVRLRWGAPASLSDFAAQLAQDSLAVVVHPSNPLTSLTRAQLRAIFNGNARRWGDLPECAQCGGALAEKDIHAWAYSPGEDIQQVIEGALGQRVQPSAAGLAPHPAAARQAVAEDPQGISLIPTRLVDGSLKTVSTSGFTEGALTRPILALTPTEPHGAAREWLGCLQEKLKP